MKILKKITLATLCSFLAVVVHATPTIEKRFVPGAQTAAISGNWALWNNPSGLAFMGGSENAAAYLYEWSTKGNRHHAGVNLATNFFNTLSIAGGINTQAAFAGDARAQLGTDLSGIFGAGLRLSPNVAFGMSFLKSYSFLSRQSRPVLISFGFQARPWSFLSFGALYQETDGTLFAAPTMSYGVSFRPLKEALTIGLDGKLLAKGKQWSDGFWFHPVVSLETIIGGYQASASAEIPWVKEGFIKPIFSVSLGVNFAHLGVTLSGLINPTENNFGVGASIRASTEAWPSISRPSGLWVELTIESDGTLEQPPATLAQRLFSAQQSPLLVLALLRRIEQDQSIAGVVLNFNGFGFGNGKTEEWREAVVALRRAHKEVIVYLDAPSERDFYIATAASKIVMNKQATLSLRHFQATLTYFADLLDKIGITADAVVAGSYKTAPRQWTNARPQKEEIEVVSTILNDFYQTFLSDTAKARTIDQDRLKAIFDRGEINAHEAKAAGLVDELVPPNDVSRRLSEESNVRFIADYEHIKFKQEAWHAPKKIVVIPISNVIVDGRASFGILSSFFPVTGAKDVTDEIEKAQNDPDVLGLIIRIDSPGGDAVAGHKINHALKTAQKFKPVVTSMSDVAASAGYLIAAGSSHILAMPNTITGSIGVFSLMFSGEKLAQKVGVFSKQLSPIENPGPTTLRAITDTERLEAQKITDWYYQNFIEEVSFGLKLDKQDVLKNAEGHVWLGHEALEKKLIHELGGFMHAVERVRMLADLPKDEDVTIEVVTPGSSQQFSLSAGLRAMFRNQQADIDVARLAPLTQPYTKALEAYRLQGTPQARLPFDIEWRKK